MAFHLLTDLEFPVSSPQLPILWCDNISAISLASNPVFHARTKHVEVDFHFVREKVLHKQLSIKFVPSDYQVADIFTKSLTISRFQFLKNKLKLCFSPASICRVVLATSETSRDHNSTQLMQSNSVTANEAYIVKSPSTSATQLVTK